MRCKYITYAGRSIVTCASVSSESVGFGTKPLT